MTGIMQMLTGGTYGFPNGWPVANIGAAYGGGFFAGQINVSGTKYNLVVAPKSTGDDPNRVWGPMGVITGYTSDIDGPVNSAGESALGASYQAARFCENLTIGGYTDWYLPSLNELEVLYYFLKPDTSANATSYGSNANAVSPEPISTNYTVGSPAQTSAGIGFRTGETNAFSSGYYWTSTEYSNNFARVQDFTNGTQASFGSKDTTYFNTRAIRRVAV
jgi:hypothetical protein